MRTLRGRLAISFAAAAAATLVLFSVVVLLVLTAMDRAEAIRNGRGAPSEEVAENTRGVLDAMAIAAPAAIGGAALLGSWLARRAVAPLKEASARARTARGSDLNLLLPLSGTRDEWDDLAGTLNTLLADSRSAVERIRRFTADAAHELRTPVTAILGEIEVALRRERTVAELRGSLEIVREEAGRMSALIEALLTLARADAGTLLQDGARTWAADKALREAAELALNDSRRAGLEGAIDIEGDGGEIRGDRVLIVRALRNLLDNALRHGGGSARVTLSQTERELHVRIEDRGPGISASLRPLLFERFARGNGSRCSDGFGLGLAIARTIVEAHGGSLNLGTSERGAAFELQLPRALPPERDQKSNVIPSDTAFGRVPV